MIKKIFSYLIPIKIYETKSSLSKSIEVTWANGELVLDSENTNYSYGSLQRILRYGLKNIGYEKIVPKNHFLVLIQAISISRTPDFYYHKINLRLFFCLYGHF